MLWSERGHPWEASGPQAEGAWQAGGNPEPLIETYAPSPGVRGGWGASPPWRVALAPGWLMESHAGHLPPGLTPSLLPTDRLSQRICPWGQSH